MKHETQIVEAKRLLALKDAGTTALADAVLRQPAADYVDGAIANCERAILFRRFPLLLGLSCEVPRPGDYLCDDFSGVPIVVRRDRDGAIAAFRNICRHRGARLLSGRGASPDRLACPYHAWTYSAESGELLTIPFERGFDGLEARCMGLVRLNAFEKNGMIFVTPSLSEPLEPREFLGELDDDLAAFGFGSYHHFETRVLEQPLNWKLVVDTFLETYHLSSLHRQTIAPILYSNLNTFAPLGRHLRMIAARRTIERLREESEATWDLVRHTAMVYVLFPNTVLVMQGDHLETWRVYPGATPDASRMHVSLYTPEPVATDSARRHWNNNMDLLMATVLREDFPLAAHMQRDFAIRDDALVFGRNEPALQHFHRTLSEALSTRIEEVP